LRALNGEYLNKLLLTMSRDCSGQEPLIQELCEEFTKLCPILIPFEVVGIGDAVIPVLDPEVAISMEVAN